MNTYTVRLYLEVRHDIPSIAAETPEEAVRKAINENNLYGLASAGGEYAEEIHGAIVDTYDYEEKLIGSHDLDVDKVFYGQ